MPTVELSFSALPAHVRTARLVAAAVARRAGVEEAVLDEVRLAVGEACSRAVELHRIHCPEEPVQVLLTDDPGSFRVDVTDRAPTTEPHVPAAGPTGDEAREQLGGEIGDASQLDGGSLPSRVGIAVITGLVDEVEIVPAGTGTSVRMTWRALVGAASDAG